MNEKSGVVFSVAADNRPMPGCTISKDVSSVNGFDIKYFALADGTDISAESCSYNKLWIVADGRLRAFIKDGGRWDIGPGASFVTPRDVPIGVEAETDAVYTEITLKEDTKMNKILKAGEVFALTDLVPYQEGKIVNIDLINDEHLKLVVMSFDDGTGLSEHAAPGEAMIFALDGTGIIGYEGKEHEIKAGENFKFDKNGKHYVKAKGQFKMALLLQID